MKKTAILMALAMVAGATTADVATITALDVRGGGVFGHTDVSDVTINGVAPGADVTAETIDYKMTYNNLDLDGDASANDSVTFTFAVSRTDAGSVRAWGQGMDAGWANMDNLVIGIKDVTGTTADLGHTIVFDGFTGLTVAGGAGAGVDINSSVILNTGLASELTYAFSATDTTAYTFLQDSKDFSGPVQTLSFSDDSVVGSSLVARNYDLQFSTVIPEPATLGLVGLFGGGLLFIRRRFMI